MTNFSRHTTDKKGASMSDREHNAKFSSESVSLRAGIRAALSSFSRSKGSGAPSVGRLRAALIVLALAIAAFAVTAAPAGAAPPTTKMGTISAVSYTSAHVKGRVTTSGGLFGSTSYSFEYSKNPGTEGWTPGPGGSISGPFTEETVESDITGLRGGTKYFIRLTAFVFGPGFVQEKGVSPEPNPSLTTLNVDPPENVSLNPPAEVFSLTAKLSGKVKRPANGSSAFDVKCRFEYISDEQFNENVTNIGPGAGFEGATQAQCEPNPVTEAGAEKVVSAKLTGLTGATTYHQRLVAETGSPQIITTAATTFTTAPTVEKPKVLSISAAATVSYRSGKVSGEIERPAGADPALNTVCHFEYVTQKQFEETGFEFPSGSAPCDQTPPNPFDGAPEPLTTPGPTPVTATLRLSSGVTYHYRLSAENAAGADSKEAAGTFATIPGGEPTFSIDPNPVVGYTTLKVSGTAAHGVGPEAEAEPLQYSVEVAESGTENWSSFSAALSSQLPPGPQNFSYEFTGLKPATEYKYRLVLVRNNGGSYEYSPEPFPTITTSPLAEPTVAFAPVTGVTANAAHFSGSVDTNAPAGPLDELGKAAYRTHWHFECTPECPGPGGGPISGTIEGEEGSDAISLEAVGLQPNTFYEVSLIAANGFYTVETPVQSFQTPLVAPTVTAAPGASDGQGGYFLEGVVNSNNTKVTSCKFEYGTTATYPNTYEAPCRPSPSGPDEVQLVNVEATEGQFKLSFRGQTTGDLPFDATPAEVQAALRALSQIGATGVNVTGTAQAYKVSFAGTLAGTNVAQIKGVSGTTPLGGGAGVGVSTETEGGTNHAVSVEAHLEALTVGSTYHFRIFATSNGGTTATTDHTFIPELASKEVCANEQQRKENNSDALPECRAYEMVTPVAKQGYGTLFEDFDGGTAVAYRAKAPNIANSGIGWLLSWYTTVRTDAGWQTLANLNGPTGSIWSGAEPVTTLGANPLYARSKDLRSADYTFVKTPVGGLQIYYRKPDGSLAVLGKALEPGPSNHLASLGSIIFVGSSDDFNRQVFNGSDGAIGGYVFGPGVYELLATGSNQPTRLDVDNSGQPIAECGNADFQGHSTLDARANAISDDANVVVMTIVGGCGGANPPANEVWARVNNTTSFDASASHCTRTAADPGGACNGPIASSGCSRSLFDGSESGPSCRGARFQGASADGSRVFFTTSQQLVNSDTDETNDIYACDIPLGASAPVGEGNSCTALIDVSGAATGAEVQHVLATSEDGSTVYFTAKGVLAANEDALGEQAVAGAENLYVWRQDAAHPAGETTFIGKLSGYDVDAQATPDGHYLVFTTATPLVLSDSDTGRDVYRYDSVADELTRASTGLSGTGGNAEGFGAGIGARTEHNKHPDISDNGQKIVFTTKEALSPLDGNGEYDVYLWTPGHVALISPGSAGTPLLNDSGEISSLPPAADIDGSGHDIYFETNAPLSPSDGDQSTDIYDARVGGGFSFAESGCSGEVCQHSDSPPPPPAARASEASGPGNPAQPTSCPKGKVRRNGKCVKKNAKGQKGSGKNHHSKKHHNSKKKHKRAGSNTGGGK